MFQTNRLEKSILLIYKEPWKWISSTQSIEWTSYIQWKVVIIIFIPTLILIFNNIIQILIDYPVSEQFFKIKEYKYCWNEL